MGIGEKRRYKMKIKTKNEGIKSVRMAENKGNCWLKITEIIRGVIIISRVFKVCSGVCDVSGLLPGVQS